jgi:general stress protein 26
MAMTRQQLAEAIGKIDFAMLTTRTEGGQLASRPMSNNGDVAWDGDSFYFSWEGARTIGDIERDRHVALSFAGSPGLFGAPPLFIAIEGEGEIIRDRAAFAEHWTKDLERYFPDGIDSPGLSLIKVHAVRAHYWNGEDEGEVGL